QRTGPVTAEHSDDGAKTLTGEPYTAMREENTIEAQGIDPLSATVERVSTTEDATAVMQMTVRLEREGIVGGPIGTGAMHDAGNPERVLLHMVQSGLGLPDESYYREDKFADVVEAYRSYNAKLVLLAELATTQDQANQRATQVIDLETRIA